MKVKVSNLIGPALDWVVARCEWPNWSGDDAIQNVTKYFYKWSTDWSQGGPIIERECIDLSAYDAASSSPKNPGYWAAVIYMEAECVEQTGPTPLIAAMRCYVASKMGDEVEVPNELVV